MAAFAIVGSMVLHLFAQAGMLFFRSDWTLSSFRAYYPFDQLSYMSMVANAARGDYAAVEPFTGTGSNFYPRAWYLLLGTIARLLDIHPATAWQLGGLAVQCVMVAAISVALILLTRRPLLGLLAPAPFVLGTFAFITNDNWFTSMDSHAVLWGPFGVLYTVNGEAASLSLAAVSIMLLQIAWARPTGPRARLILTLVAAAVIGFLANVQTYSFLTVVYLATMVAAFWALVNWGNRIGAAITAALAVSLFVIGPMVFDRFGQLPALVFGLLPALPGLLVLLRRVGPVVILYFGVAVLAASPQVVATVAGIVSEDPFLSYRVASNRNLGVEAVPGLIGSGALLLPLVALLVAGLIRRRPLWVAYPLGAATTWILLATNDRWGPNAEPYRLWIDSFVLVGVGLLPLFAQAAVDLLGRRRAGVADQSDQSSDATITGAESPPRQVPRRIAAAVVTVVLGAAAVSAVDWVKFVRADDIHGVFTFTDDRSQAQARLASRAGDSALIAMDTCTDPQVVKLNTAAPVAFYNLGMAWPRQRDEIQEYLAERAEGRYSSATLKAAGIEFILTDSACGDGWVARLPADADAVDSADYLGGQVTLWSLRDVTVRDAR